MSNGFTYKPVPRSTWRIAAGRLVYTIARYARWYLGGEKYARQREEVYPVQVCNHQTILLRQLKAVDMQLQYNKVKNLRLAVAKLNKVAIYPGEIFSYWKLIGRPTRRKGYVDGMVLFYGGFRPGVGGGLCQLSNLIYWLTLHTPLTVVARYRHSYDVFPDVNRTQPFGSGATCAYNYIDLMIKNDTEQPFQLELNLTDTHLAGAWRTSHQLDFYYEVYERKHWISHEPWGGYIRHNIIARRKYDQDHKLVEDDFITENHAIMMYQPLLDTGIRE